MRFAKTHPVWTGVGVVAAIAVIGTAEIAAVGTVGGTSSTRYGITAGMAGTAMTTPSITAPACLGSTATYTGSGCFSGDSSIRTVTAVPAADSLTLDNGITVHLAGIDTPAADACAGSDALNLTSTRTKGQSVQVIPAGTPNTVYILTRTTAAGQFDRDLGVELVREGLATTADGDANFDYMKQVRQASSYPENADKGVYSPACTGETTTPPPPPASTSGTSGTSPDAHVYIDRPNLPDGALTGGLCRHTRWC